jgi:hypothetical protein
VAVGINKIPFSVFHLGGVVYIGMTVQPRQEQVSY